MDKELKVALAVGLSVVLGIILISILKAYFFSAYEKSSGICLTQISCTREMNKELKRMNDLNERKLRETK